MDLGILEGMTIREILTAIEQGEKNKMYLEAAYSVIDELKAEIKELEEANNELEQRTYKAENKVEELEVRLSGSYD